MAGIEPPESTWGKPITNQFDEREALIESHGLTKRERDKIVRKGGTDETISTFDKRRFGVATSDGYAFATHHESVETIGEVSDPLERISRIRSGLDEAVVDNGRTDVPEDIEQRLKHLGYA